MTSYQQSQFDLLEHVISNCGLSLGCDPAMDYDYPNLKDFTPKQRTNRVQEDHHSRTKERLRAMLNKRMDDKKIKPSDYKSTLPSSVGQAPSNAVEAELPALSAFSPVSSVASPEPVAMDMDVMSPEPQPGQLLSPMSVSPDENGRPDEEHFGMSGYDNLASTQFADLANQIQPGHAIQDQGFLSQIVGLTEHSADPVLANPDKEDLEYLEAINDEIQISEIMEDLKNCERAPVADQHLINDDELNNVTLFRSSMDLLENFPQTSTSEQGYVAPETKKKQNWPVSGGVIYEPPRRPAPQQAPPHIPQAPPQLMFDEFGNPIKALPGIQTFHQRANPVPVVATPPSVEVLIKYQGGVYQVNAQLGQRVSVIKDQFKQMSGLTDTFFFTDQYFRCVPEDRVIDGPGRLTFQTNVLPKETRPVRRRLPKPEK